MRKVCVVVFLLVVCCVWAVELHSKSFANKNVCKKVCEEVMILVGNGKIDEALKTLEPYWLFGRSEFDKVYIHTINQMELVKPRFGKIIGYEFVREEMINDTIMRLTYIQKFERHAIRWIFLFYKPDDKWLLNSFTWDDKISQLFE